MASITVRQLDDALKAKLRLRAARHNRSMEDEVREILRTTLADEAGPPSNLAEAIRRRFQPLGGIELTPLPREPAREPPRFEAESESET